MAISHDSEIMKSESLSFPLGSDRMEDFRGGPRANPRGARIVQIRGPLGNFKYERNPLSEGENEGILE